MASFTAINHPKPDGPRTALPSLRDVLQEHFTERRPLPSARPSTSVTSTKEYQPFPRHHVLTGRINKSRSPPESSQILRGSRMAAHRSSQEALQTLLDRYAGNEQRYNYLRTKFTYKNPSNHYEGLLCTRSECWNRGPFLNPRDASAHNQAHRSRDRYRLAAKPAQSDLSLSSARIAHPNVLRNRITSISSYLAAKRQRLRDHVGV